MKNICVITGASSGIGKAFFLSLAKDKDFDFDEFWVIARSEDRLLALAKESEIPVRAIPLDLSSEESYESYRKLLEAEKLLPEFEKMLEDAVNNEEVIQVGE